MMNKPMYGLMVCLLAYFMAPEHTCGQNLPVEYPEILPPSPEASAFAKFGDLPVSTYSGTPNIEIPIYQAQYGEVSIPISL